jgi:hypothetical protein
VLAQPHHAIALSTSDRIHRCLDFAKPVGRHLELQLSDPIDQELNGQSLLGVLIDQAVGFLVKGCWQLVPHRFEGLVAAFDDLLLFHRAFRS